MSRRMMSHPGRIVLRSELYGSTDWAERVYAGALRIQGGLLAEWSLEIGMYDLMEADKLEKVLAYIKERRARRCTATTTQSRATSAVAI